MNSLARKEKLKKKNMFFFSLSKTQYFGQGIFLTFHPKRHISFPIITPTTTSYPQIPLLLILFIHSTDQRLSRKAKSSQNNNRNLENLAAADPQLYRTIVDQIKGKKKVSPSRVASANFGISPPLQLRWTFLLHS